MTIRHRKMTYTYRVAGFDEALRRLTKKPARREKPARRKGPVKMPKFSIQERADD